MRSLAGRFVLVELEARSRHKRKRVNLPSRLTAAKRFIIFPKSRAWVCSALPGRERVTVKAITQIISFLLGIAACIVIGIVLAAVIKHTSFTAEWAAMIEWISTWAK